MKDEFPVVKAKFVVIPRRCCSCNKMITGKVFKILEMNRTIRRVFSAYSCTSCGKTEEDLRREVLKIYLRTL